MYHLHIKKHNLSLLLLLVGILGDLGCSNPAPPPPPPPPPTAAPPPDGPKSARLPAVIGAQRESPPPIPTDRCERIAHPYKQPIAIINDADVSPYPPVLGFPVAFPAGADLRSTKGFFVAALDGTILPSQMEVLSRWGSSPADCAAPVRWAYVHVLGALSPDERAFVRLEHQPANEPPNPIRLLTAETEEQFLIDTGPARFAIRKDWFNGLSTVELRGLEGFRTISQLPIDATAGFMIKQGKRTGSPIYGKIEQISLERGGPVLATLAVKGSYALSNRRALIGFTIRLHFFAGTASVQIDHALYNRSRKPLKLDQAMARFPLNLSGTTTISARLSTKRHDLKDEEVIAKISNQAKLIAGAKELETGAATAPYLAISANGYYTMATFTNGKKSLRYDKAGRALELHFSSAPLTLQPAGGHWSSALLDFGNTSGIDFNRRGNQLHQRANRPLIGAPRIAYINQTGAYGRLPEGPVARFDALAKSLHAASMKKAPQDEHGPGNDWPLIELERFLRTAAPGALHDLARPHIIEHAETGLNRAPKDNNAGLFCLSSKNCNAQNSPNRSLRLAYILTADRRFVDLFIEGADAATRTFGERPSERPKSGRELSAGLSAVHRLELLLSAAEFQRNQKRSKQYLWAAARYFDFMRTRSLQRGHVCDLTGTKTADPKRKRACSSIEAPDLAWLVEWVQTLASFGDKKEAQAWLSEHTKSGAVRYMPAKVSTSSTSTAGPDSKQWRSKYRCAVKRGAVDDESCAPDGSPLDDAGVLAYLSALALLDGDKARCSWLPAAYAKALQRVADAPKNGFDPATGRALAFAQRALAELERCR